MDRLLADVRALIHKYRWTIWLILISFTLLFFSFLPVDDEVPRQLYAYIAGMCTYAAHENYLHVSQNPNL